MTLREVTPQLTTDLIYTVSDHFSNQLTLLRYYQGPPSGFVRSTTSVSTRED